MANFEEVVFGRKKFSEILKEIYDRSASKEKQINELILQLQELIQNIGDATMMVPLIAKYMELNIKNDDALIKMAAIIQNAINKSKDTGDSTLSETEKEELLKLAQESMVDKMVSTKKSLPES
jgi:hypothetical protein